MPFYLYLLRATIKACVRCAQMSDFFGALNSGNIRQPDSQWNVGPLPSVSGGPSGSSGDPDGVINGSGDLLSNIVPYAYATSARTGSDRNYQQIPHRIQKIVPQLFLPPADMHEPNLFPLSHAVDQGDIAFIINTSRIQNITFSNTQQLDAAVANVRLPSRDALINLCCVNYLLAGLQRLKFDTPLSQQATNAWFRFAKDMNYNDPRFDEKTNILRFFQTAFIPFGICAGSEKQGGLHETGLAPVQAAVNHVTTLCIDGQNRDLVNLWRNVNINAGDQLIFRLEYLPTRSFTLNHYYKGTVHQNFNTEEYCWQVVPDVFRMAYDNTKFEGQARNKLPFPYDYRLDGYWRIGQSFQHRNIEDGNVQNYSNDMAFLRGQLLQITFAPVWVRMQHSSAKKAIQKGITLRSSTDKKKYVPQKQSIELGKRKFFQVPNLTTSSATASNTTPMPADNSDHDIIVRQQLQSLLPVEESKKTQASVSENLAGSSSGTLTGKRLKIKKV